MKISPLVVTVEKIWKQIQRRHPEVPDVIVTIGSGTLGGGDRQTLGHFAQNRWIAKENGAVIHELFIGGEGLRRSAAEVLSTLLHEASHGLAVARGIQDTSRQGRYHNQRFKELAEELRLDVVHTKDIGWSTSTLTELGQWDYRREIAGLERAMLTHRRNEIALGTAEPGTEGEGSDGDEDKTARKSSNNGVSMSCPCGRKLRVSLKERDRGPIICGLCMEPYDEPEPDDD
ncbi:hypothetical protein IU500_12505 [Nocardia terpenica]|uniref:hypothetical protein n=1 Tax=Nocardia terpenica TaxID=455432 RepID=UPI001893761D|nr:hypothetical protein [Nocardia terpenica]MBF6063001.1 hypothetical protein [Nocardia terpenica]MBF6104864.1 hypothetical protein [Nocardia terpenica]MBF6112699.1 hypothetical protein [Nocardia terpenica]MBF6118592.1 hypothetical protein [Nocardia terpenica]MBF6155071.1 hypothetical protein [Nocardia terpenica]